MEQAQQAKAPKRAVEQDGVKRKIVREEAWVVAKHSALVVNVYVQNVATKFHIKEALHAHQSNALRAAHQ